MPKHPVLSGQQVIKALSKLGLKPVRQRGNHVFLKGIVKERLRFTVVPVHNELAQGTLKGILEQTGVTIEELLENI